MSYFVFIGLLYSFLFGVVYFRAQYLNYDLRSALDLGLVIMLSGFVGARLTHVFFESPEIYAEDWTRVFQFWFGGFVFYGGAILAFLCTLLFFHLQKLNFFQWSDFYAPICALGYGLGRVSCFLAGCCYGRTCNLPWAIDGKHPTQLYAVVWELVLFILLLGMERSKKLKPGSLFLVWLIFHSIGRMIMEYYREDFRGPEWAGLSLSTWISLVIFGASFSLFLNRQFLSKSSNK